MLAGLTGAGWGQAKGVGPSIWADGRPPSLAPGSGPSPAGPVNQLQAGMVEGYAWDHYHPPLSGGLVNGTDLLLQPQMDYETAAPRFRLALAYQPTWWDYQRQPNRNRWDQSLHVSAGYALNQQNWLRGINDDQLQRGGASLGGFRPAIGQLNPSTQMWLQSARLEWLHRTGGGSWWQVYGLSSLRHYANVLATQTATLPRTERWESGIQYSHEFSPGWRERWRVFWQRDQIGPGMRVGVGGLWASLGWQWSRRWQLEVYGGPESLGLAELASSGTTTWRRQRQWQPTGGMALRYQGRWRLRLQLERQAGTAAGLLLVPAISTTGSLRWGRIWHRRWQWEWVAAGAQSSGLALTGTSPRLFSLWTGPLLGWQLRRGLWLRAQWDQLWQRHRGPVQAGLSQDMTRLALSLSYRLPAWGWNQ